MGLRGPAPVPTKILEARGNRFLVKKRKSEPQPESGMPDCPEWLSEPAKIVWAEAARVLEPMKVATRADQAALARYCDCFVRWKNAAAFIAEHGETYAIKDAEQKIKCLMPFPEVAIYSKLAEMLIKLEDRFGLSPSARTRISVSAEAENKASGGKSRFFGGPKLAV